MRAGLVLTEQGEMLFRTAHDVLVKLETIKTKLTESEGHGRPACCA